MKIDLSKRERGFIISGILNRNFRSAPIPNTDVMIESDLERALYYKLGGWDLEKIYERHGKDVDLFDLSNYYSDEDWKEDCEAF